MSIQKETRTRAKIQKIKKALAEDKKFWHGQYHDGRGYRYLQPELYILLEDFKGAFRYFRWFEKNFPGDSGNWLFLFYWAFTLFKNNKPSEAEQKLKQVFIANEFCLYKFLDIDIEIKNLDEHKKWLLAQTSEWSLNERKTELYEDFASWMSPIVNSQEFISVHK